MRILGNNHIGNMVLPRPVGSHNGRYEILRHILVIGQKLLRILGQAVSAVTKRRIVIKITNTGIEADAFDDFLRTQAAHFSIRIEFIEIGYAQSQICIGKELNGFGFGRTGKQHGDIFLDGAFGQQMGKDLGPFRPFTDDDARRMEIVIQGLAFTQKFWRKDNIIRMVLLLNLRRITYGDGRLDDHDRIGIDIQYLFDDRFY